MRSDIEALCLEHCIRPNPSQLAFHHTKVRGYVANHDASLGKSGLYASTVCCRNLTRVGKDVS